MRVSRDGDHAITSVQSPYILGYFQCPMASSATVTHSRRQCCVYGCHNRKGFCPITSSGDRACNCPPSRASKRCPDSESHRLPTLHTINSLDEDVRKTVLQYMRRNSVSSRSGNQWVPNKDDSICNFHFPDNIGPSGFDKKRFPLKEKFFKPERPSSGMEQYVKPRLSFSKSLRQDRAKKTPKRQRGNFVDESSRFFCCKSMPQRRRKCRGRCVSGCFTRNALRGLP